MHEVYQTYPSGDLRSNPGVAFDMADKAPVIIMARATPRVIMVNPEQWNATVRRLSYLEDLLAGDAASERVAAGEYDTVEDVDAMMAV